MILDTSFLIDVLRGNETVTEWEAELAESAVPVVTAISVMELWEGIQLADASDAERRRVRALLSELTHASFDLDSAMIAGERSAELVREGPQIDLEDVMIAAIALERGEPVLTRNPEHFERIPDVAVETY
jgi:tRNA(fMet)-specific endonuclease VapC